MRIFGLHIITDNRLLDRIVSAEKACNDLWFKEYKYLETKNAKDNSLWNKVISKLLWENYHMRLALRR